MAEFFVDVGLTPAQAKKKVKVGDYVTMDEPFIEVHGFQPECLLDGGYLDATTTNGSNRMQLMVFGNEEQFLLVARYDNLGKGASGAAVQNLNLMLGLEETLGLSG